MMYVGITGYGKHLLAQPAHAAGFCCGGGDVRDPEVEKFYTSRKWRKCRDAFANSRGWLCERCLEHDVINAGNNDRNSPDYNPIECHHKIRLTAENVNDASVSLNWNNLELLCQRCHEEEHGKRRQRTDEDGHVHL